MKTGINGHISYHPEYGGIAIYLRKYDGLKLYRPVEGSIQWEECSEGSVSYPIAIASDFYDGRSEGEKGNLYGENQALKAEVKFLREQIAKLVDRV